MKKILMLGTGGTIASEITESGLSPQLTTEQILHYCPDISGFCSVDCLQLCNLDSTNIAPEHWKRMADSIRKEYNHYDGFVLTHGTDTMAYTAAALSYLIQYSKKPIVLTGSQNPSIWRSPIAKPTWWMPSITPPTRMPTGFLSYSMVG